MTSPVLRLLGRLLPAALISAWILVACGGGSVGSGGTGAFSQGAITGFGSIIVNGVRFDDSSASVEDEDDDTSPGRSPSDLKLGMVVTIAGDAGSDSASGTAHNVRFGSELKGPVQSINGSTTTSSTVSGTQTVVVLGQSVQIGTRTVFDPLSLPGGFADIGVGDVLEVHGHLDPTANTITATRINREPGASHYKITGNVSSLNTASRSFNIGSTTISYALVPADRLRVTLADGVTVKARLSTVQTSSPTWDAQRIKPAARKHGDQGRAELEGIVTAFTSTSTFSINGIPVDASGASFPKGSAVIVLGARVEAKGRMAGGTLVATRVKLEDDEDEDNQLELHGAISALSTGSKTFELRGFTVDYASAVFPRGGSASDLANGKAVEVKGEAGTLAGSVKAKVIKFE